MATVQGCCMAAQAHCLTHVLSDTSLMDSPKAMPQHAFELPFIFSLPISRVPFALLRLP